MQNEMMTGINSNPPKNSNGFELKLAKNRLQNPGIKGKINIRTKTR